MQQGPRNQLQAKQKQQVSAISVQPMEQTEKVEAMKISNEEIIRQVANKQRTITKPQTNLPKSSSSQQHKSKPVEQKSTKVVIQKNLIPNKESKQPSQLDFQQSNKPDVTNEINLQELETMKVKMDLYEKQQIVKLKEKNREISILREKQLQIEEENQDCRKEIKQLKILLNQRIDSENCVFNERRNLVMTQRLLKQSQLIISYTRAMNKTKMIQAELEHQIDKLTYNIQSLLQAESKNIQLHKWLDQFNNTLQSVSQQLKYIQSQEQYKQSDELENSKSGKFRMDTMRAENCLVEVVQHFENCQSVYWKIQLYLQKVDFNKCRLNDTLATLSSYLIQKSTSIQPTKQLFPEIQSLLDAQSIRVQHKFTSLFPNYNSHKEQILNLVKDDKIYKQLTKHEVNLKEIKFQITQLQTNVQIPSAFLYRSIFILQSLLIHTLLCIHTFNLEPQLKGLQLGLIPFVEDCLNIVQEYSNQENQLIGQQTLWRLWQMHLKEVKQHVNSTKEQINLLKQQYSGLWNDVLSDIQQH